MNTSSESTKEFNRTRSHKTKNNASKWYTVFFAVICFHKALLVSSGFSSLFVNCWHMQAKGGRIFRLWPMGPVTSFDTIIYLRLAMWIFCISTFKPFSWRLSKVFANYLAGGCLIIVINILWVYFCATIDNLWIFFNLLSFFGKNVIIFPPFTVPCSCGDILSRSPCGFACLWRHKSCKCFYSEFFEFCCSHIPYSHFCIFAISHSFFIFNIIFLVVIWLIILCVCWLARYSCLCTF